MAVYVYTWSVNSVVGEQLLLLWVNSCDKMGKQMF